jgi:hypothetical protein
LYDAFRFSEKALASSSMQAAKVFFGFLKSRRFTIIKLS